MKNRTTSSLRSALALASAFVLPALASAQTLIKEWTFNDPASTALNATAQTGTLAGNWSNTLAGVTTNGAGVLNVGFNGTTSGTSRFADFGAPPTVYATGLLRLELKVAAWDFSASANTSLTGNSIPLFGFGFDTGAATVGRLNFEYSSAANGGAGGIVLDYFAGLAANDVDLATFSLITSQALTLIFDLNQTADTYSVAYSFTGGSTTVLAADVPLDATFAARNPNALFIRSRGNFTNSTFQIDNLSVTLNPTTPIPEPATATSLAGLAVLGAVALRRRRA